MSKNITLNDLPLADKELEGVKGGYMTAINNLKAFKADASDDPRRQSFQMISNISKA